MRLNADDIVRSLDADDTFPLFNFLSIGYSGNITPIEAVMQWLVYEIYFRLLLTSWATKPLRQLYPDLSAESAASNAARVEYVEIRSHLALLTMSSIIAIHGLNPRSKDDADHA